MVELARVPFYGCSCRKPPNEGIVSPLLSDLTMGRKKTQSSQPGDWVVMEDRKPSGDGGRCNVITRV